MRVLVDGEEIVIPPRLEALARWILTEAERVLQDPCSYKVIANLACGDAPLHLVVERHERLVNLEAKR